MRENYINECKQIQQNSEYTAETHHRIANWNRVLAYVFQIIPAAIAAMTSALVAADIQPISWLWVTVIAAVVSTVASILDPNSQYQDHLNAAKAFTILKHDARFLHASKSQHLSDDAFFIAVENLHEKYNEVVKIVPPTTQRFFELARQRVQAGRHDPDRDKAGNIK